MPYPITIVLYNNSWKENAVFGPIAEGDVFCVPLLKSFATTMRVKPSSWAELAPGLSWPCSRQVHDFDSNRDIVLVNQDSHESVCFRMICIQRNLSLLVSFQPYVTITNRLLCSLQFSCFLQNENATTEEGLLLPGMSCKLTKVSLAFPAKMALRVGCFNWSKPRIIDAASGEVKYCELVKGSDLTSSRLVLGMLATEGIGKIVNVDIFSTAAIVDRTGLKLSVWSSRQGRDLIRNTFMPEESSPVTREIISQREKQRRSRILKNIATNSLSIPTILASDMTMPILTTAELAQESNDQAEFVKVIPVRPTEQLPGDVTEDLESKDPETTSAPLIGLNLDTLAVDSRRKYEVVCADVGDLVYTDSTIRWTHLPAQLRKQAYIRTPTSDRNLRSRSLIQFELTSAAVVLVLIDLKVRYPPKWLQEDGFHKIVQQAIARSVHKGDVSEYHFVMYGKYFDSGAKVVLRGNWCKDVNFMYASFVIPMTEDGHLINPFSPEKSPCPAPTAQFTGKRIRDCEIDQIFEQVTFSDRYSRSTAEHSWVEGNNGLSLLHFDLDDAKVAIGVHGGAAWSEILSINASTDSSNGSFEIVDWATMHSYQLSYSSRFLPGLFNFTQQLEIVPRFCIVNCMNETLSVVQLGAREITKVNSFHSTCWHKSNAAFGTNLQFRSVSSLWSFGSVDINEMGTTVLYLPRRTELPPGPATVLHVEVKPADPKEHCLIMIVVWEASVEGSCAMSVRNESDFSICVRQASVETSGELFNLSVHPGQWLPFGWADPDASTDVQVCVGVGAWTAPRARVAVISMLKAGDKMRLPDSSGRPGPAGELVLSVVAEKGGRILKISRVGLLKRSESMISPSLLNTPTVGISINLSTVGISLILDKPVRREFLSAYIDGLEARFKSKGGMKSLEFMVMDLQIDNYSPTAINPVLLRR